MCVIGVRRRMVGVEGLLCERVGNCKDLAKRDVGVVPNIEAIWPSADGRISVWLADAGHVALGIVRVLPGPQTPWIACPNYIDRGRNKGLHGDVKTTGGTPRHVRLHQVMPLSEQAEVCAGKLVAGIQDIGFLRRVSRDREPVDRIAIGIVCLLGSEARSEEHTSE